ncbi:MAG: class I SAM-dependent methyltransferase [Desulfomonilaceae bacterium]
MFNPLNWPIVFARPAKVVPSGWIEHIPFAFLLIQCHQPSLFVELGTEQGASYCAFCQAVDLLRLSTKCYAVDTWEGDEHTGPYSEEIFQELLQYNATYYSSFSSLLRMRFDEALDRFDDRTIDLLHIDGCHTYTAVEHDFESWLPKMSARGVVLLHDTIVRQRDFGVWALVEKLRNLYPVFEFTHGYGLAVVAVGSALTSGSEEPLMQLMDARDQEAESIRRFFSVLGSKLTIEASLAASNSGFLRGLSIKRPRLTEYLRRLARRLVWFERRK